MNFIENLSCECEECHFNHDQYCYIESVTLDIGASCEDMQTCENYDCNECEFFDLCSKEKKYNSSAFSSDENIFPAEN
jgi:hypothetical protein